MRKIDKPWGYEFVWAETKKYVGKTFHINDGFCLSLQHHNIKNETNTMQSGILTLEIGCDQSQKIFTLSPGETYHISPSTIHRMSALNGVDVIEVSTPKLNDVVRLKDNYGHL